RIPNKPRGSESRRVGAIQGAVSVRSQFTALGACLVVWVAAHSAAAQPTELFECFGHSVPACSDVAGGLFTDFDCFQYHYEGYRGRVAWFPLRYVGAVTLEIWARSVPGTRFPLFFEILPLQGRDPLLGYCDGPGEVLVAAQRRNDCGSDTYGP